MLLFFWLGGLGARTLGDRTIDPAVQGVPVKKNGVYLKSQPKNVSTTQTLIYSAQYSATLLWCMKTSHTVS